MEDDFNRINNSEKVIHDVHISIHNSGQNSSLEIDKHQKITIDYYTWKKTQTYKGDIGKSICSPSSQEDIIYGLLKNSKFIIVHSAKNSRLKVIHRIS